MKDLILRLFYNGPTECDINAYPASRMLNGGLIERHGDRKCRLTMRGYLEALRMDGDVIDETNDLTVSRAIEDLLHFRETLPIPHTAVIRDILVLFQHGEELDYALWMLYFNDGFDDWLNEEYPNLNLTRRDRKNIAYYALMLYSGLAVVINEKGWFDPYTNEPLRNNRRYPNLSRVVIDGEERPTLWGNSGYRYTLENVLTEYYNDGEDYYIAAQYSCDDTWAWTMPKVPFIQYYSDNWGRVPSVALSKIPEINTPATGYYDEDELVLTRAKAMDVIDAANHVISQWDGIKPYEFDSDTVMGDLVSPELYSAVKHALDTRPKHPVHIGEFKVLPLKVAEETTQYYEVCWVNPYFEKPLLTVQRIAGGKVRII